MDALVISNLDSLLAQIDRLDPDSRAELGARLAHEDTDTRPIKGGTSIQSDYAWAALADVTGERRSQSTFTAAYKSWKYRRQMAILENYIAQNVRGRLTMPMRMAVTKELLKLLHSYIRGVRVRDRKSGAERNLPSTINSVLDRMNWLPDAVEDAFPGYAAAGILDKVLIMMARD